MEDALKMLEQGLVAVPDSDEILTAMAELCEYVGKFSKAMNCYSQLIERQPKNPAYYLGWARSRFEYLKVSKSLDGRAIELLDNGMALPGNLLMDQYYYHKGMFSGYSNKEKSII